MEIHRFSTFAFTGCGRPLAASLLNGLRFLVLLVPLSLLAWRFGSLTGLFIARLVTDVLSGVIGVMLALRMVNGLPPKQGKSDLQSGGKRIKL